MSLLHINMRYETGCERADWLPINKFVSIPCYCSVFYAGQFWINQLRRLVPSRGSGILSETWMSSLPDSTRTEIQSLPNWGIHSCSRSPSLTFQPSGLKTLRRSKWKWTGRGGNVICPTVHHCHQKEQKRLDTGKLDFIQSHFADTGRLL